jgi:hypothetical protein
VPKSKPAKKTSISPITTRKSSRARRITAKAAAKVLDGIPSSLAPIPEGVQMVETAVRASSPRSREQLTPLQLPDSSQEVIDSEALRIWRNAPRDTLSPEPVTARPSKIVKLKMTPSKVATILSPEKSFAHRLGLGLTGGEPTKGTKRARIGENDLPTPKRLRLEESEDSPLAKKSQRTLLPSSPMIETPTRKRVRSLVGDSQTMPSKKRKTRAVDTPAPTSDGSNHGEPELQWQKPLTPDSPAFSVTATANATPLEPTTAVPRKRVKLILKHNWKDGDPVINSF